MKEKRAWNRVALWFGATLVMLLAVSCAKSPEVTAPAPTATSTAAPTVTQVPTATPTVIPLTPTPTAVVQVVQFEEAPCPFGAPDGQTAECGYVTVPEDHFAERPDGRTIRLAVAVFKADEGERPPDPLIMLCGGPGEKCVASASVIAIRLDALRGGRDLVVFDQRGVGLSEPALECPEWEEAYLDSVDETDQNVVLESTFAAWMACRDRFVAEGYNLSAFNTRQNAADVHALRIALGYDQVNLFGGSYGSFLAQAVMREYPEMIRSAVIDTVWPIEKSFLVDVPTNASQAMLHLLESCNDDQACDASYPDLQEALFAVVDRLNAEPVPIQITDPRTGEQRDAWLTGDSIVANLTVFMYQTTMLPVLPQAIYDVYQGDYDLMAQLSSTRLGLLSASSRGMMLSVVCAEDLIGRTPEDLKATLDSVPPQLVGSADWETIKKYSIFGICEQWPVSQVDPSFKEPLVSDLPALVLSGEYDPVTPAKWGRLVASYLSQGTFYEFPGIAHSVNMASECARSVTQSFLEDPHSPPQAACVNEMPEVAFDVPGETPEEIVLEPFENEVMGVSGLLPQGWEEVAPRNYRRGETGLDQTFLALDAVSATAEQLLVGLSKQLGYDPAIEPLQTLEANDLTWSLYQFSIRDLSADLAISQGEVNAYFVLVVSDPDEHEILYGEVFVPVVEALKPAE